MSAIKTQFRGKDQWVRLVLSRNLLPESIVQEVVEQAAARHSDIAQLLVEERHLTDDQIAGLKAEAAGVAFMDVADYQIDPAALHLVPESVARTHHVLPLYRIDNALTVAMEDPWDVVAIDALRVSSKLPMIHPVVASAGAIRKAIERAYGRQVVERAAQPRPAANTDLATAAAALAGKSAAEAANEGTIIKLVDALLAEALDARASDIHIEPSTDAVRLRCRIDGVLHELKQLPLSLHEALCCRIKILAKMDIAEHRQPQDGHIPMKVTGRMVDLRISTYPTVTGENVVIRLLDQSAVALKLESLGLSADALSHLQELIRRPHGLLLVTGPTGSGKTTTLYASLMQINTVEKNLMTIEDPVEYQLPLIRQTQINPKAGVTFATGLRSILRQDPDVIMVGEIRDRETAEIAIHAALTGHLVLSTLHTNDAVGAVARLLDIGLEPYLLSSTLLGVIAQRLVRRICHNCQEGGRPSAEQKRHNPALTVVYHGRGCHACRQTGYAGRVGVYELLVADDTIRAQVTSHATSDTLRRLAVERGMRTMRSDGLMKVQQGLTTLEELDRVVPRDVDG
ncbi:MAG: type II secretion system protein GspE [Candidatus Omnitrophica bacterium CG11_big_fil_rev_8_21_14_0_20_63_9]|nr:MAG: type II secretion system protein GspE [Candidatus Omnitrophica bacterium CG11_big_fil_rev_8_21_14_0_20_63_9]